MRSDFLEIHICLLQIVLSPIKPSKPIFVGVNNYLIDIEII